MYLAYLKIKVVSLAAEATLIRNAENRIKFGREIEYSYVNEKTGETVTKQKRVKRKRNEIQDAVFWGLRNHRIEDVRSEARAAQVAYGYLRGKTYEQVEGGTLTSPNWSRVYTLVEKYGRHTNRRLDHQAVREWSGQAAPPKSLLDRAKSIFHHPV
jgi:hypothetical protein